MINIIDPNNPLAQGGGVHTSKATIDLGYDTAASEGHSLALNVNVNVNVNVNATAGAGLYGLAGTYQDVTSADATNYPAAGTLHFGPQLGAEIVPVGELTISPREVIEDIADYFSNE